MEQQNVDTVNIRMKNGPVAKKKQYHHPDLRQTLLDEAVKLIDDEGLRGFSLRKLAVRAGVSHAAPYRHFENKDEILVILMLEGHKRLRQALLAALGTDEAVSTRDAWRTMLWMAARDAYLAVCGQETPRQIKAFTEGWKKLNAKPKDPETKTKKTKTKKKGEKR